MANTTKLFIVIGCLLILIALVLKIAGLPLVIAARPIRPISLVILANTSFLLALLSKK